MTFFSYWVLTSLQLKNCLLLIIGYVSENKQNSLSFPRYCTVQQNDRGFLWSFVGKWFPHRNMNFTTCFPSVTILSLKHLLKAKARHQSTSKIWVANEVFGLMFRNSKDNKLSFHYHFRSVAFPPSLSGRMLTKCHCQAAMQLPHSCLEEQNTQKQSIFWTFSPFWHSAASFIMMYCHQ